MRSSISLSLPLSVSLVHSFTSNTLTFHLFVAILLNPQMIHAYFSFGVRFAIDKTHWNENNTVFVRFHEPKPCDPNGFALCEHSTECTFDNIVRDISSTIFKISIQFNFQFDWCKLLEILNIA